MSYKYAVRAPTRYEADWLNIEFERIEQGLQTFDLVNLVQTNVAPSKPRSGDVRFADGTNWNPGGGQGIYAFYNSTWNKLG